MLVLSLFTNYLKIQSDLISLEKYKCSGKYVVDMVSNNTHLLTMQQRTWTLSYNNQQVTHLLFAFSTIDEVRKVPRQETIYVVLSWFSGVSEMTIDNKLSYLNWSTVIPSAISSENKSRTDEVQQISKTTCRISVLVGLLVFFESLLMAGYSLI